MENCENSSMLNLEGKMAPVLRKELGVWDRVDKPASIIYLLADVPSGHLLRLSQLADEFHRRGYFSEYSLPPF